MKPYMRHPPYMALQGKKRFFLHGIVKINAIIILSHCNNRLNFFLEIEAGNYLFLMNIESKFGFKFI